ncbi:MULTISPECIES: His-Xaa-Ser system radical SAM maturase HxsC [Phyllobacteriaceae]|jgi:His-Xaa-Ser system radical SAM maturase HxsC|uniref:His-Xaa-Ser system radical SAM maturase HxsC n=1 Tax=Mesorhizobium hungaricum TaxID=1566387 RepID=A0A1C2DN45_9HYPH|nr:MULTISPECIES: His-Xaa-Ser system radical SAM maturase HxsC [Mesorhizobium]MBN9236907.1 His-Xaa-Ser system radical SAM maturase HxsC [Mesorhizobium sp.]MDQ0328173.1 His-Xaa-Ser system radical SAM maturase HxsC [Mesorhizobium sp. YL-MeA3-2017]OCX16055.1 His-Xaa-Ser system radical SAM maturase HxsC [Mesorhizobium hungaricum]
MIPLRIKAETQATQPFVIRLRSFEGTDSVDVRANTSAFDVSLETAGAEAAEYVGEGGSVRILGIDPSEVDGDVLLVNPRRGTADRLIRSTSPHNTFLVTERCDQLCVMCSQPPKKQHVDLFEHFETAAMLAPEGATIGISGGEPTLFKAQLLGFLARVMLAREDLRFHVLTNGQHFESADREVMLALDRSRVVWGVPLYSADPTIHDEIVGKAGAFEKLQSGLAFLGRAGAQIELRTVLMQPNAQGLPRLARYLTTSVPFIQTWAIMQLENIGYARQNWSRLFFDSSTGFETVAQAIDIARSRSIDVQLFNFPLCTVPGPYRHLAPSTISDWKRAYMDDCKNCSLRGDCGGFFEWHPREHGYASLGGV